MKIVQAKGNSIRSALTAARKLLGIKHSDAPEQRRDGGEDNSWRVTLTNGQIVEVQLKQHAQAEAWFSGATE